ncbi:hypothetical protein AB0I81_29205 [Nonomuraea sp. NPDC050404]|uniref:hypothetical protein n=1 Tax=Nonomuraea sp. NPDC050404 TaxID=3155783 RepID=UPI0033E243EA
MLAALTELGHLPAGQYGEGAAANSADPARIAQIIGDLAGRDDAPTRILLGRDAL